jgi:saccharopine dehydrogenase-like NADP-dependent oxidoreductase
MSKSKKKVLVLGCGLVGATMARDLAADPALEVTVADVNLHALKEVARADANLRTVQGDLSDVATIRKLIRRFDGVVGALPSRFGFATLRAVIEGGKPYCDISFMPEDALALDELAKKHRVPAVVDCGVAPGLANLAIGWAHARLEVTENAVYYVGGLPWIRTWPYEYKAPFSPADVVEEYTRPARMVVDGKPVTKPALSDAELMDFPGIGTLEAFNTDGLRSLIKTCPAINMKEKTLRYPGHIALMRVLRETGFFSKEPIYVGGLEIRPLEVTSALLFPHWKKLPNEREFTVLKVIVEGRKGKVRERHVFDLFDEYDPKTGNSSMARTTGFPCTIMARQLLWGRFRKPGVFPPELLGKEPDLLEHMIQELARRGVHLTHRSERIA